MVHPAGTNSNRSVENPFKEKSSPLLHYGGILLIAFCFTALVVYSHDGSAAMIQSEYDATEKLKLDAEPPISAHKNPDQNFRPKRIHPGIVVNEEFPYFEDKEEFMKWIPNYIKTLNWPLANKKDDDEKKLTKEILSKAAVLGCDNIAANQIEAVGNFNYQYDFVKKEMDNDDSQVRQAGALWAMSMCHQNDPANEVYAKAVKKGLQFFLKQPVPGPGEDSIVIKYMDDTQSDTGANALVGLSMIEYLRTADGGNVPVEQQDDEFTSKIRTQLRQLINSLKNLQRTDQHFSSSFVVDRKVPRNNYSPYYDGETMLCLVKAARYLDGYADLIPVIEAATPYLLQTYSTDAWRFGKHDSDLTKGFYQWSSMFLTEYYEAGWKDADVMGDMVVLLGHWIIHTHVILRRQRNTGYAYEGIISAYQVAKAKGYDDPQLRFEEVIDQGLHALITWQVGSPLADQNPFLADHPTNEAIAVGGVMNAKDEAPLRIDTTQHQTHAVMMAIASVYA